MEKVGEEWKKTWQSVRINYEREVEGAFIPCSDFVKILTKYVGEGGLILEAGCGYGVYCLYFNIIKGASCVGIDIVIEPLKALKSYLRVTQHKTHIIASDVTNVPFREGVFDIVTSFGVIEHFRHESEVVGSLNEASRVLRKGGFLILIIPNFAASFRNKLVIALSKGRFGMYHKPYTKSILTNMFNAVNGLKIVEIGFTSFGFRQLIFGASSHEKLIYFMYHATWRMLNFLVKIISGENYQDPIYIVAKRVTTQ